MKATDLTVVGFYWWFSGAGEPEPTVVHFDGDSKHCFTIVGDERNYHASEMSGEFIGPIEYQTRDPDLCVHGKHPADGRAKIVNLRGWMYCGRCGSGSYGKTEYPPREHPAAYIDPQFGYQEREPK